MQKILVDSNILLDIFNEDSEWCKWSSQKLIECIDHAKIIINPIVFAEISITFDSLGTLEKTLRAADVNWSDLPPEACFYAGKAFKKYRKNGGNKLLPLPDFFIGAHAEVEDIPLLTRDTKSYQTYFPNLQLIAPLL